MIGEKYAYYPDLNIVWIYQEVTLVSFVATSWTGLYAVVLTENGSLLNTKIDNLRLLSVVQKEQSE